ncbi:HMG box-containing protein C19G7.04, partial [Intoshia linei]
SSFIVSNDYVSYELNNDSEDESILDSINLSIDSCNIVDETSLEKSLYSFIVPDNYISFDDKSIPLTVNVDEKTESEDDSLRETKKNKIYFSMYDNEKEPKIDKILKEKETDTSIRYEKFKNKLASDKISTPKMKDNLEYRIDCEYIESLSNETKLKKSWITDRKLITEKCIYIYNKWIFQINNLSSLLSTSWNKRLIKTSGRCIGKKNVKCGEKIITCHIELSCKVCDSPDRIRDTLLHEMCHGAVFLIDKDIHHGHGHLWKKYVIKSKSVFSKIPVVETCHSYAINYKFYYRCENCQLQEGRFKRNLKVENGGCSKCNGKIVVLIEEKKNKKNLIKFEPRKISSFAQYVKENYSTIKTRNEKSHKDVMKQLSEMFNKNKPK